MPIDSKTISISCLCGRFHTSAPIPKASLPLRGLICHCYGCRHSTGTLGNAHVRWPASYPDFSLLSSYTFSPRVFIYFCPNCGTSLFWQFIEAPFRRLLVSAAVIDDPDSNVQLTQHLCVMGSKDGGMADFLPVIDNKPLPRWAGMVENEPKNLSGLLPLGWKLEQEAKHEDILNAKCFCGGVNFQITRPSSSAQSSDPSVKNWIESTRDRYLSMFCVCRPCRLAASTDAMPWAFIPTANIKMTNGDPYRPEFGTMKWYRSSDRAMRSFCAECGATVFFASEDTKVDGNNWLLDVATGLFCAAEGARADDWLIWRTWKFAWEDEATHAKFTEALKAGLQSWGEKNYDPKDVVHSNEGRSEVFTGMRAASQVP